MLSTGYEPTSDNTLSAAVTSNGGDIDVDIPYGGGTGSYGGTVTLAPTTPPPKPNPIQSIMPAAVVHHGAPLAAAPFYGGGGPTSALALPSEGSISQTTTSNQLIPFQVNVNLPNNGSPGKIELQNEVLLLKQRMNCLNMELCQAQMAVAQTYGHESQFKVRAAEIMASFEATAAEAKHIWSESHEVSMGMLKAECQKITFN